MFGSLETVKGRVPFAQEFFPPSIFLYIILYFPSLFLDFNIRIFKNFESKHQMSQFETQIHYLGINLTENHRGPTMCRDIQGVGPMAKYPTGKQGCGTEFTKAGRMEVTEVEYQQRKEQLLPLDPSSLLSEVSQGKL